MPRKVLKTPAGVTERTIPAITKTETRQVQKEDGTFETISVPVKVGPPVTELVKVPATFETVVETIVTQEASTEMVLVPIDAAEPVQDTVVVTGSRQAQGGISSVDSILNDIRKKANRIEAENSASPVSREEIREYSARLQQKANISLFVNQQEIFAPNPVSYTHLTLPTIYSV